MQLYVLTEGIVYRTLRQTCLNFAYILYVNDNKQACFVITCYTTQKLE